MQHQRLHINCLLIMVALSLLVSCSSTASGISALSGQFPLTGNGNVERPQSAAMQPTVTIAGASETSPQTPVSSNTEAPVATSTKAVEVTTATEPSSTWYQKPVSPVPVTVYAYGEVPVVKSPIYTSLGNAVNRTGDVKHSSDSSLVYLSYSDTAVVDGETYYRVGPDQWMTQDSIIPRTYSDFSGLVMPQSDASGFGWVIQDTQSILIDSETGEKHTGNAYVRFNVFQVLSVQGDVETLLYEIAPGEWIDEDSFSYMSPTSQPPAEVKDCSWIEVSLSEQNLAVYENCQVVFATLISSGKNTAWTAPGIYRIGNKEEYITLSDLNPGSPDSYFLEDVPWVMYYAGTWAIHAAYWHSNFGYPASHGCITLSPIDARYLYSWTKRGEVMRIVQ